VPYVLVLIIQKSYIPFGQYTEFLTLDGRDLDWPHSGNLNASAWAVNVIHNPLTVIHPSMGHLSVLVYYY
jgi:hypothetical protein